MKPPELASLPRDVRHWAQGLAADNDALRGDLDSLHGELDEARTELAELRSRQPAPDAAAEAANARTVAELQAQVHALRRAAQDASAAAEAQSYLNDVERLGSTLNSSTLGDYAVTVHRVALEIEHARLAHAQHAAILEAELTAVHDTVSWRLTRPLRAVRRAWNASIRALSRGRWRPGEERVVRDQRAS